MSSLTTNLKLVKPELQDNITPTIFADNFDKIDAALEGVSGGALSLEEIEASTNLDGKIPSAAALKEVNNSLASLFRGIDTTNIVQNYITSGTYTATEDCYAVGRIRCSTAQQVAVVYIDGVEVSATGLTSSIPLFLPVKKGQTVSFNNVFGGQIIFYGFK